MRWPLTGGHLKIPVTFALRRPRTACAQADGYPWKRSVWRLEASRVRQLAIGKPALIILLPMIPKCMTTHVARVPQYITTYYIMV